MQNIRRQKIEEFDSEIDSSLRHRLHASERVTGLACALRMRARLHSYVIRLKVRSLEYGFREVTGLTLIAHIR